MHRNVYIKVIFTFILLISTCGALFLSMKNGVEIGAVNGYQDLTDFHFQMNIAVLNGQWEYKEHNNMKDSETPSYVNFPDEWNELGKTKKVGDAGSYYLHMKLPKKGIYMFHMNCIPCSYRIYVNGEMIGGAGDVQESVKERKLLWNADNYICKIDREDVVVELETSNVLYSSIGHVYGMIFGTYDTMNRTYLISVIRSVILIGMFGGFGIYLLMLYEPGGRRKSYLYLGVFGIAIAFFEVQIDLYLFQYFWRNPPFALFNRLNLLLYSICCVSYSLYQQESQQKKKMRASYIVNGINILYLILIVISKYPIFCFLKKIYIPIFLLNMIYPLVFTIQALWSKRKYSLLNICSYVVICATSFVDIFIVSEKKETFSYSGNYCVGILFFLLCQMYILSQRNLDEFHESCEKKDMEIAFLQAQIAPHFFFNTLNNIYCMMDVAQEKAKSILLDFCNFLRVKYKFDYRTEVYYSLLEEVDMVAAFVRIENERFSHKIMFHESIEESCREIQIPPLLLQPIVENAIKHGMSEKNLTISLSAMSLGNLVEIVIQDDGKGMGIDQVNRIMNHRVNATGIGLDNINSRLNKCFHTSLMIESSVGRGTIVKLHIPIKR